LAKAADAAAAAGSRMAAAVGTKHFQQALHMSTEMRHRYLEIAERLRRHRELAHAAYPDLSARQDHHQSEAK
jgi:hypothetical protein